MHFLLESRASCHDIQNQYIFAYVKLGYLQFCVFNRVSFLFLYFNDCIVIATTYYLYRAHVNFDCVNTITYTYMCILLYIAQNFDGRKSEEF